MAVFELLGSTSSHTFSVEDQAAIAKALEAQGLSTDAAKSTRYAAGGDLKCSRIACLSKKKASLVSLTGKDLFNKTLIDNDIFVINSDNHKLKVHLPLKSVE